MWYMVCMLLLQRVLGLYVLDKPGDEISGSVLCLGTASCSLHIFRQASLSICPNCFQVGTSLCLGDGKEN